MVPGSPQKIAPGVVVDPGAVEGDVLAVGLHRQLLEVGGEAVQVLVVGQDGAGFGAEEVAVPDREQAHQHRQVFGQRRLAEVLVHRVEAGQHLGEAGRADRQHRREPDRRVHRVAAPDPLPEPEHVVGVDPERGDLLGVGRDRDEVLRDRRLVAAEAGQRPLAGGAGVGHRLQRREGLRGDDEQGLLGVEVAGRLDEVGAVDVGDEAEGHLAPAEVAQRLVGHHRAEVGAADPDVDDVADRPAGVADPLAAAHPLAEVAHPVEGLVDLLDDVDAVDDQRAAARHPQRDVEHGPVLGDVDVLAGEHRFAPFVDAALGGEVAEQQQRLVDDPVLREVEVEAGAVGDEALAARRVGVEEVAQVAVGSSAWWRSSACQAPVSRSSLTLVLFLDRAEQLAPGLVEGLLALLLEPGGERFDLDPGLGELGQDPLGVAAVGRQRARRSRRDRRTPSGCPPGIVLIVNGAASAST